jgi:hypothetical protein
MKLLTSFETACDCFPVEMRLINHGVTKKAEKTLP